MVIITAPDGNHRPQSPQFQSLKGISGYYNEFSPDDRAIARQFQSLKGISGYYNNLSIGDMCDCNVSIPERD